MTGNPQQDPYGYPKLDIKAARALKPHVFSVVIDSILGGIAISDYFARPDEFRFSTGIDPALPAIDNFVPNVSFSGLLRPSNVPTQDHLTIPRPVMWLVEGVRDSKIYIYDFAGSTYSFTYVGGAGVTALADGGSMSGATGNGAAYYDNYIYFAKNTDIARYGPLNGSPTFDGTYWTSTLSKGALGNNSYPQTVAAPSVNYPNHVMHRHSDGKLYIADVQNNQGVLHVISTTKSSVEGDTDNGSTFQKITFGYGLWPTAIESYGSGLAISFWEEGSNTFGVPKARAKIAFWDTTSQNFNSITWAEYPDGFITGLRNLNGTLYIISGETSSYGFRLSRYIGGYSFKDVAAYPFGYPPLPGAFVSTNNRLMFGVQAYGGGANTDGSGTVFSLGLGNTGLGEHLFGNIRTSGTVTALVASRATGTMSYNQPMVAWSQGLLNLQGIDAMTTQPGTNYAQTPAYWESRVFRIGQTAKITKIRIPFAQTLTANMSLTAAIMKPSGAVIQTLTAITGTNYPNKDVVILRPQNLIVDNDFFLSLQWGGTSLCTVALPITIELEEIPDNE